MLTTMNLKLNTNIMKTTTGLTIIHDGNRVNVYTKDELKELENKNIFEKTLKSVLKILNLKN